MSAIRYNENLNLLRSTVRELSRTIKRDNGQNIVQDPSVQHMLHLFRDNQVTERRFCRPQDHYKYFAQTYHTYLKSSRLQDEITQKYFNKEEKSIKDSAKLVGLELPKQFES